jgi:type IV fimbrial biogenesis protein FimT
MLSRSTTSQSGFSLIELMIGVVILGILTAVAVPSFQTWMRNSQVRNAAESISNGLQRARAEAVSRNTRVAFILENNSSWSVNIVDAALTPASAVIQTRSSSEGSKNVTVTALAADDPTITPPTFLIATPATTITFNNLGGITPNSGANPAIALVNLSAESGSQNLSVTIGVAGNAKVCNPSAAAGSPTAC